MVIKMNDAAPWPLRSRGVGPGDSSDLTGITEITRTRHDQEFDGIDWSAAAPSWRPMFTGLFLPLLAFALLVASIDLALSWSFGRWIDPSLGMSPLLLAAIMFLPALISAFCSCKLFLHLKDRMR
jgi:hypothetical protein